MKNRFLWAAAVLLLAMLACSARTDPQQAEGIQSTQVLNVGVSPPYGKDSFTLQVEFESIIQKKGVLQTFLYPPTIYCNYVTPDGATMLIGSIDPMKFRKTDSDWETSTAQLAFSVRQADGEIIAGVYLAGCSTGEDTPIGATFTVVEEPTPTAPSVPNPVPTTMPSTPASALTWGRITYDPASDQQMPHLQSGGIRPSEFHKWCNPSITVDANGAISGNCSSSQNPADLGLYGTWFGPGSSIEGKVTGTLVPGGSFTFHEELTEKYENPDNPAIWWAIRTVVLDGTGTFVSATQARGTASYSAECTGSNESANYCGEGYTLSKHDSFTGTINWEFNGGVTWQPDRVSSLHLREEQARRVEINRMAAILPQRGLVSDMLKKYLDLIFKT